MKQPSSNHSKLSQSKNSHILFENSDLVGSEDIQLSDLSSKSANTNNNSISDSISSNTTPSISKMSSTSLLHENEQHSEINFDIDLEEENDEEILNLYKDNKLSTKIKRFFYRLWKGPIEAKDEYAPRINKLKYFEELPDKFNERIPLLYKRLLLSTYLIFWFGLIYTILIPYFTIPPYSPQDPNTHIYSLSCSSDSQFWNGKNTACGLNGELCPEILKHNDKDKDIIIRCPALCDRGSWTYSLIPIGNQRIKHRGYFIGGGDQIPPGKKIDKNQITNPYRADSFPCGSAIHAGIVSPIWGGCARMSYKSANQPYFNSTKGHYGVDDSISFKSFFKSSFFFKNLKSGGGDQFVQCTDPRIIILIINILLGIPIVYLSNGAVTYWVTNIVGFWTICLATDPPINVDATNPQDFAYLISIGLERFLPTCSILYILWHFSTKRTLSATSDVKISYLSRLFLFYPLFWLGVLNNVTFDRLPVDRLTVNDLKEQSGAILAVSGIIITITTCGFIQAYKIWLSGRFKKYLLIYSIFVIGLIFLAGIPGLTLRVHHYILAMLLIPGCATRGRTALMFQGILLGLFLSGASRWGLAAIAETITSLKRDDPQGTLIPPILTSYDIQTGELNWENIPTNITTTLTTVYEKYSSISILINDIEHLIVDNSSSVNFKQLLTNTTNPIYTWVQDGLKNGLKDLNGDIPIFIRIGRKIPNTKIYSDFSNAAILKWPSGELTLQSPGMT
ncbi:uncharacterized protein KGF55_001983 [Candida pseudojiufengensis]|uniref:uncharacterized protein n=1 Tax=Candida pseudojiufengensis TaxID=497109 RepID=UPI002223F5FF|nr:uncharacterized protein KGF55_001983 [Candida pseudojiufengensis]KAI5964912.1 hypothetical protein KGF55_001983 [Candida pseudojiufengensis]